MGMFWLTGGTPSYANLIVSDAWRSRRRAPSRLPVPTQRTTILSYEYLRRNTIMPTYLMSIALTFMKSDTAI
jgi:hypothetical protein